MKEIIVSFIQLFTIIGAVISFSYYYNEINKDIPNSLRTLSIISSLNLGLQLFFGIFCSYIINEIGFFFSSLISFLLIGLSFIGTSFVNNINIIYFTYGIICAIGFSMLITMSASIILYKYGDSENFSKIFGISTLGSSFGLIIIPFIIQYLKIGLNLTWRENIRYVGIGICVAGFLLCFLMKPFEKPIIQTLDTIITLKSSFNYLIKNYKYIMLVLAVTIYGTVHSVFYTYIIVYLTYNNDIEIKKTLSIPIIGIVSIFGKIITGFIAKKYPRQIYSICLLLVSTAYFIFANYTNNELWNIYIVSFIIGFFGESSFTCYSSAMLTTIDNNYSNYATGLTFTIRAPLTIILFIGLSYIQNSYGYFVLWTTCGCVTLSAFCLSLYKINS
jgi:MFS family permease